MFSRRSEAYDDTEDVAYVRERLYSALKLEGVMAKRKVTFVMDGDGMRPSTGKDGLLALKVPVPLTIPPGGKVTVNLGIRSDRALLLVSTDRLFVPPGPASPGQPLQLEVVNRGAGIVLLEPGDTVAKAYPLDAGDTEVA